MRFFPSGEVRRRSSPTCGAASGFDRDPVKQYELGPIPLLPLLGCFKHPNPSPPTCWHSSCCGASRLRQDRCRPVPCLSVLQYVERCRGDRHRGPRICSHPRRTTRTTCGAPDALRGGGSNGGHPEGCQPQGPGPSKTPLTYDEERDIWPFLPATQRMKRPLMSKPKEWPKKILPKVQAPKYNT